MSFLVSLIFWLPASTGDGSALFDRGRDLFPGYVGCTGAFSDKVKFPLEPPIRLPHSSKRPVTFFFETGVFI